MTGLLEQMIKRQSRFKGRIDRILRELVAWEHPRDGKVVSFTIPPEIRARIDRQCRLWGATTTKQFLGACVMIGLQQMEEISSARGDSGEQPEEHTSQDHSPADAESVEQFTNRMKTLIEDTKK
jgi:hypothetical protein